MAQSVDASLQRISSMTGLIKLDDEKCKTRSVMSLLFFIQVLLTAFGVIALGFDLNFGLNTSNSKFVSFCHSLHVCHAYSQLRKKAHDPEVWWKRFLLATLSKFGGGTIISFVLWKRPVYLRSYRHMAFFAFAYITSQQRFFEDFVRTWYLNLLIKLSVALYRVRKILFIVHVTSNFAELECPIELMHALLHYWKGFCVCLVCSVVEFLGGTFLRQWSCRTIETRNACLWFWKNPGFAVSSLAAILLFYGTVIQSTFDPILFKVLTLMIFYLQYIGKDLTMTKVIPGIAQNLQQRLSEYDRSSIRHIQEVDVDDPLPLLPESPQDKSEAISEPIAEPKKER